MKRILMLSLLVLALAAHGANADAPIDPGAHPYVFRQGDITEDLYLAGREVRVAAHAAGDVVVAGGRVQIAREVDGDVIAAGGQVDIDAQVHDDVRAFGGQLRLGGNIGGDAVAAGGFVRLLPGATVGGRAWLAGRHVEIDGDVAGEVRAAASTVTISGRITGDVFVRASTLRLLPTARIEGNLTHQGPKPPQVESGAVIAGELAHEPMAHPIMSMGGRERGLAHEDAMQGTAGDGASDMASDVTSGAGIGASIMFTLMLIAAAFLYHVIFPRFSLAASATIGRRPWAALGLGVAMLFVIPPLAVALTATVIGAPIGFVAMLCYPVLLLLGFFTGMMFFSRALLRSIGRHRESARWLLLALIPAFAILWLCYLLIPGIAAFASLVLIVFGTGAVTLQAMRARNLSQGEGRGATAHQVSAAQVGAHTGAGAEPPGDPIERPH